MDDTKDAEEHAVSTLTVADYVSAPSVVQQTVIPAVLDDAEHGAQDGLGSSGDVRHVASASTTESLVDAVLTLVRLSRRFGDVSMFSLPWLPYAVLRCLQDSATDVRLTEVAETLACDISVLSRQVNAMIENGFLSRVRDPNDGRAWLLRLTTHGQMRLQEATHRRVVMCSEYLSAFDDAEQALCTRLVQHLSDGLIDAARHHTTNEHSPG
ncbi:MAG: MarR family winged helix-turn-helix transcriptional regulator [Propionibacteriaceae bacterium]|nr:MarR family winged helix-turn-helix transcriptional regulator [Propionibacteriaceae bacterium]